MLRSLFVTALVRHLIPPDTPHIAWGGVGLRESGGADESLNLNGGTAMLL